MKFYLFIALTISLIFQSCKKSNDFRKVRAEDIIFAYDKPVYNKYEDILIAVTYFKQPHEELALMLNGAKGNLIREEKAEPYTDLFLYKFNGIAADEAEVSFLINGNAVKTESLRFANDMSLTAVWDKLDKDYVKNQYQILNFTSEKISTLHKFPANIYERDEDGNLVNIAGKDKSLLSMGNYGEGIVDNCYLKPFISGLEGSYIFIFNEDGSLYQIRVTQRYRTYIYPERTFSSINQQLSTVYGKPVLTKDLWHTQVNVYKSGSFQVTITQLYDGTISSVIEKL